MSSTTDHSNSNVFKWNDSHYVTRGSIWFRNDDKLKMNRKSIQSYTFFSDQGVDFSPVLEHLIRSLPKIDGNDYSTNL